MDKLESFASHKHSDLEKQRDKSINNKTIPKAQALKRKAKLFLKLIIKGVTIGHMLNFLWSFNSSAKWGNQMNALYLDFMIIYHVLIYVRSQKVVLVEFYYIVFI